MRIRCGLIGVLFGLCGLSLAQSIPTASDLAARIERAGKTVSYAAVRSITIRSERGNRTFEERVLRSGDKMYLSYESGTPYADQQIYEVGGKRYTYTKSNNELRVAPIRGGGLETYKLLEEAAKKGGVKVSRGDAVASRATYFVEIASDRGRGTHRIWVDREKYVVLKRSFAVTSSEEIGGFEVLKIDFSAKISSSKFKWPSKAKLITVQDDVRRLAKELGIKPMMIPDSGKMALVSTGKMEVRGQNILRQFYTDGERRLSLFVMKQTDAEMRFSMRGVEVHRWNFGGMTLILIGDFSEAELKKFASRVRA